MYHSVLSICTTFYVYISEITACSYCDHVSSLMRRTIVLAKVTLTQQHAHAFLQAGFMFLFLPYFGVRNKQPKFLS